MGIRCESVWDTEPAAKVNIWWCSRQNQREPKESGRCIPFQTFGREKLSSARSHVHEKPIKLQMKLIESVSSPGDVIVDPAAGSFSVMAAAITAGRNFLGCDING